MSTTPPITIERFTELAHRTASRYSHRSEPSKIAYTFLPHTLEHFHHLVCADIGTTTQADHPKQDPGMVEAYKPGEWFDATTVDLMQAFFESRLPAIRETAKEHGYAIGLHGSMRRDLDLIAAPWREGAADPDTLAHAIAMAACGITRAGAYEWEKKPAGRVATCLPICWTHRHGVLSDGHIDLSVMPAQAAQNTPAGTLAIEALEAAKNGLDWYRQEYPEQVNGSDDEADQLIERAITALSATAGDPT